MIVSRTDTLVRIMGPTPEALEALKKRFSYFVEGAKYSEKYNQRDRDGNRLWDGYIRLVKWDRNTGTYTAPVGIFDDIKSFLDGRDELVDYRDDRSEAPAAPALNHYSYPYKPRDYQPEAVETAVRRECGILRLPVRSGKTFIASLIIHRLATRTLFVVPSIALLKQSADVMQARFPRAKVSLLGNGKKDASGDIVVCTNATLVKQWKALNEIGFGLLILDEAHHSSGTGTTWRDALLGLATRYRYGMTATLDIPRFGAALENRTIWTRAICGPIIFEKTTSELIRLGYIQKPLIRFVRHRAPRDETPWDPASTIERNITSCEERNRALVDAAEPYWKDGCTVLFDAQRIAHCRILHAEICRRISPGEVALVTGSVKKEHRDKILEQFGRKIRVVVGNLLGEGIDIPHLQIVVNCEGGRGMAATIQRLRNLNAVEGKGRSVVLDAMDHHHPKLREATLERARTYKREEEFEVVIDPKEAA